MYISGKKGPNKEVVCDAPDATDANCKFGDGDNKVTGDIFPVSFYNQTIRPNSAAARAVLYGK